MTQQLLICTDLDRTLIPNGPQSESPTAREHFALMATHPEVTLAYVSGRHRALVDRAIANYRLPVPDYVIGDVGTTMYRVGPKRLWQKLTAWEDEIAKDWGGKSHAELRALSRDIPSLRPQELSKQNDYKLSYYVPLHSDRNALSAMIDARLKASGVTARLIWSVDEPTGIGLLDILPASASKYHAVEALMRLQEFDYTNTVFCGDSGNDIEVLISPIAAVLVANAQPQVRNLALKLAQEGGHGQQLYIAKGGFHSMNGNYAAGILEGIAHYHPHTLDWMGFEDAERQA
jgi:sucrose-6F-phosphate phosphohydrolase